MPGLLWANLQMMGSQGCALKKLEIVLMMPHLDTWLIGVKLMRIFCLQKETINDYSTELSQVWGYSSLNHLGRGPGTDMLISYGGSLFKSL